MRPLLLPALDLLSKASNWDERYDELLSQDLHPRDFRALAALSLTLGNREIASRICRRALAAHPLDPQMALLGGDVAFALKDQSSARSRWEESSASSMHTDIRLLWSAVAQGELGFPVTPALEAMPDGAALKAIRLLLHHDLDAAERQVSHIDQTVLTDEVASLLMLLLAASRGDQPSDLLDQHVRLLRVWAPTRFCSHVCDLFDRSASRAKLSRATGDLVQRIPNAAVSTRGRLAPDELVAVVRKGLTRFPDSRLLAHLYVESAPLDPWLLRRVDPAVLSDACAERLNSALDDPIPSDARVLSEPCPITFNALGGGVDIGASAYMLEHDGRRLLLDAGIATFREGVDSYPQLDAIDGSVDGVVISHAHMDHCGALPKVRSLWPDATCVSTSLTRDLCAMQFSSWLYDGRDEVRLGSGLRADLAELKDAAVANMVTPAYGDWVDCFTGCRIRLHDSGHVAGAAAVEIAWDDLRVVYTGDFSSQPQVLSDGFRPEKVDHCDLLVMEATRASAPKADSWGEQMVDLITATADGVKAGRPVLIPVSTLGRCQELLCALVAARRAGVLEDVPIFLGGSAKRACRLVARSSGHAGLLMAAALRDVEFLNTRGDSPELPLDGIYLATSAGMTSGTASKWINDALLSLGAPPLVLRSRREDDDSGSCAGRSTGRQALYHLETHASSDDLLRMVSTGKPKSAVVVHWGYASADAAAQSDFIELLRLSSGRSALTWVGAPGKFAPGRPVDWLINRARGD